MKILIRVDQKCGKDEMIGKIKSLIDKYGKGIASFENPEDKNPHFHIWMETDSTVQSVRDKFKRMFEVSGNAEYSMSTKDGSLKYICKDGEIVYNNWFSDEEIRVAKESWVPDEEFKSKSKKKKSENSFLDIYNYVYEEYFASCQSSPDFWETGEHVIDYYQKNYKRHPSHYQLKPLVESLVRHYCYENKPDLYKRFRRQLVLESLGPMFKF